MLAKDFVSDLIPAVTVMESANQVVRRMCEFKVSHLPVLEGADYLGLISEKDIRNLADQNQLIGANSVRFSETSVMESQHIYEVIDTISRHDLTVLPVLTSGKKYLGCITLPALVKAFSLLCAAGQPGAILVLSLGLQDYSPTMLSRIIEDNHAKIVSLYVIPDQNGRELIVTIKVNTQETSSIMRSFDRYGYTVKSYYLANSQLDDFYRTRYEELMKYMNI